MVFGGRIRDHLVERGLIGADDTLDGPWSGTVHEVTGNVPDDAIPEVLRHTKIALYLTGTRLVFMALRGASSMTLPLVDVVHLNRTEDRDIALVCAPALGQVLRIVWRPSRSGDPGRDLAQRRDARLRELTGEPLYARELRAGTAFGLLNAPKLAAQAFTTAAQSTDPFVAATAALALGDLALDAGDRATAEHRYRAALAFRTPDVEAGSALAIMIEEAQNQLDGLSRP